MTILVPLDLSDTSKKAIEPAVELASALGDDLLLVTVAGIRLRNDLKALSEAEHAPVPEMIEGFLKSTSARVRGVNTDYRVLSGDDAAEALVDYAKTDSIRMIVMATHGRSGIDRWRLGSVTERVVRHSELPVLVIPTRKPA